MHEASLMKDLMRQLKKIADAENARRVSAVHVWLGALSHMSHEHFVEHFEQAASGTLADGARVFTTLSQDSDDPNAQSIILEQIEVEVEEP